MFNINYVLGDEFRGVLIESEQQLDTLTHKIKILSADLELSKEKVSGIVDNKLCKLITH